MINEHKQQSLITHYATGVSSLQPASSPFDLNRDGDIKVWVAALELQPSHFTEQNGTNFFKKNRLSFPLVSMLVFRHCILCMK